MLGYLVPSAARRRLLHLLWSEREHGSALVLARAVGVSYAAVYRELQLMVRHGLATKSVVNGEVNYAAAFDHPNAELVQRLLATSVSRNVSTPDDATLRGQLRALGAPLPDPEAPLPDADLESVLVRAVELSRRDPTVARVLPFVLWRLRDALDWDRLEHVARSHRQNQAVGFLLTLAGRLGHDRRVERRGARFRDRRVKSLRPFFELPLTRAAERTAERRTPELSRRWGFVMNMQLADFESAFDKFAPGERP